MVIELNQREVQQSLKRTRSEALYARANGAAGSDAANHAKEPRTSALIGLLCQAASSAPHHKLHCGGAAEPHLDSRKAQSNPSHDQAVQHCISAASISISCSYSCARAAESAVQPPMQICPLCQKQVLSGELKAHVNAELAEMLAGNEPPLGRSQSVLGTSSGIHQASAERASHQERSAALDGTAIQPKAHSGSYTHNSAPGSNTGRIERAASGINNTCVPEREFPSEQAQYGFGRHHTSRLAASLVLDYSDCSGKLPKPLGRGNAGVYREQEMGRGTQRQQQQDSIRDDYRTSSRGVGVHDSAGNGRAGVSSIAPSYTQPHLAGSKQRVAQQPSKVLVLGGGQKDEHVLKRQKRVQMGRQAKKAGHPAHYNHYHTGNGFWDSDMVGLDGVENLGTSMWEGVGTMTWGGLGPQ